MYSDKTQKVHVALTEQTNVIKTGDNRYFTFIGDENTYSISELVFRNTSISLEGLLDELKGGRCIGQIYNTDPYQRVPGSKPKFDWRGSSWIGVDIDDSNVAPLTMHNELRWTPTFTMTTQSHWKGEHTNRYRIFYFFNTVMQNYDGFRKVAERIASDVRRVLTNHGENYKKVFDDKTKDRSRFYYGNPYTCQTESSWITYAPSEIYENYTNEVTDEMERPHSSDSEQVVKEEKILRPARWKELHECCLNPKYSFEMLVRRFHKYYHIRFMTQVDYQDDGSAFTLPPENYMFLHFRWVNRPACKGKEVKKWHDGEHRRRILAIQLQMLQYMNNFELKLDQLVFHAIYLFHFAYCNADEKGKKCYGKEFITPAWVMDKATQIYYQSEDEIKHFIEDELKKDEGQCAFLVNRQTAISRGMTIMQLLGEARHQYNQFLWEPRIEILMPYIQKAYSNSKLAKILERETGEVFKPETIGSHVAKYRDYRVNQDAKNENGHGNAPKMNLEMPENEHFTRKICANLYFSYDNKEFSSVPVAPEAAPACCALSNPHSHIMGGKLSPTHQSAVTTKLTKANRARRSDANWKQQQFNNVYDDESSDKENKIRIRRELGIGERSYYKYKEKRKKEGIRHS